MRISSLPWCLCLGGLCSAVAPAVAQTATPPPAARSSRQTSGTQGRFIADYGPKCKDPNHEKLRTALKKAGYLEAMVAKINGFYAVPRNITVSIKEIGVPNAFWSADEARITIGYELMDDALAAFSKEGLGDAELVRKMFNVTQFVLFHEVGHALVSELGLPITGREEDAVDQFSTYLLLLQSNHEKRSYKDASSGGFAAIDGAKYFALTSSNTIDERSFWNEHSLNQQRFYDIIALVHGNSPRAYDFLVKTKMLPAARAENSMLEWMRVLGSWGRLTNPYLRRTNP